MWKCIKNGDDCEIMLSEITKNEQWTYNKSIPMKLEHENSIINGSLCWVVYDTFQMLQNLLRTLQIITARKIMKTNQMDWRGTQQKKKEQRKQIPTKVKRSQKKEHSANSVFDLVNLCALQMQTQTICRHRNEFNWKINSWYFNQS